MLQERCDYGRFIAVSIPYDSAVAAVKDALKEEGFGVLCEIDVAKTLKEKLGVDVEPHVILGACNPVLARQALAAEPNLGLLLPCNVVVREDARATFIGAIDPMKMLQFAGNPALTPVAADAAARLNRVLDRLSAQ
jgi:uncharacterized protein (DUF302 family)